MDKIILISDTHGDLPLLVELVEREKDAIAFFHAGDGYQEVKTLKKLYPYRKIYGVTGNCDGDSIGPEKLLVQLRGKTVFLTHGHLYGVKKGLVTLGEVGLALGADLVLYGHTHQGRVTKIKGMHLINGGYGSLKLGNKASYACIEWGAGPPVIEYKEWGNQDGYSGK